jgi:hypothetical protein
MIVLVESAEASVGAGAARDDVLRVDVYPVDVDVASIRLDVARSELDVDLGTKPIGRERREAYRGVRRGGVGLRPARAEHDQRKRQQQRRRDAGAAKRSPAAAPRRSAAAAVAHRLMRAGRRRRCGHGRRRCHRSAVSDSHGATAYRPRAAAVAGDLRPEGRGRPAALPRGLRHLPRPLQASLLCAGLRPVCRVAADRIAGRSDRGRRGSRCWRRAAKRRASRWPGRCSAPPRVLARGPRPLAQVRRPSWRGRSHLGATKPFCFATRRGGPRPGFVAVVGRRGRRA